VGSLLTSTELGYDPAEAVRTDEHSRSLLTNEITRGYLLTAMVVGNVPPAAAHYRSNGGGYEFVQTVRQHRGQRRTRRPTG
jgi:hypothetical protein